MREFSLLLATILMFAFSVLAQHKLVVHKINGEIVEFTVSDIAYIDFSENTNTTDVINANGYDYVDLGLPSGILWASCNIGAEYPEEYGDYFSWGEIETKESHNTSTYKWLDGSYYTKYCTYFEYGTVDNKTILELNDDAANVNWGGTWRIPTKENIEELREQCTWVWETKNNINGYTVIGPNGKSIFLPAAGCHFNTEKANIGVFGCYWSSSFYTFESNLISSLLFNIDNWNDKEREGELARYIGLSIRPVLDKGFTYEINFNSNGGVNTMSPITTRVAEVQTIPENLFVRAGYEFICWNTKIDGSGMNYEKGDKICVGSNITLYAQWYKKENNITHEYVDLGLSVKWATCNIGANYPEEIGYLFAWGETKPKAKYNWETYTWCNGTQSQTKYCDSDNKTNLDYLDDAAEVNWGNYWRMPTKKEQDELRTECSWKQDTRNGINGYTVIGPNGNSIFLPITGYRKYSNINQFQIGGYYWSKTLSTYNSFTASTIKFGNKNITWSDYNRYLGLPVRPVLPK